MDFMIHVDDEEMNRAVSKVLIDYVTDQIINSELHQGYIYRKTIKDVVREVIKENIDELSDRAVAAAAKSIENKVIKTKIDKLLGGEADA